MNERIELVPGKEGEVRYYVRTREGIKPLSKELLGSITAQSMAWPRIKLSAGGEISPATAYIDHETGEPESMAAHVSLGRRPAREEFPDVEKFSDKVLSESEALAFLTDENGHEIMPDATSS